MPFIADKKTLGGFVSNVGSSGANLITSTAGAVLNPFETVKNIISLAKNPQVVIDYYKQRYGKDLLETLYIDPVGVAADLSVLAGGVSGVAKLGGAGKIAKVAGEVSKISDPFSIVGKVVPKGVRQKVSTKLGEASENILTKGLGNPAKQAEIQAKYGVKPAQFIKKYNLYDRSPGKLAELEKSLGEQYGNISKTTKATFDPTKVIAEIDKKIAELSSGSAGFSSANQSMVKELAKRREQFVGLMGSETNAPISSLIEYRKQGIDPDIPMSEFGLNPKQSGKVAGIKKTRDILRAQINESVPELKQLGIDIAVAKKFKPVFGGSRARGANRQILGIPKQGATIGTVLGGIPGLVGGAALDYLTNSPKSLKVFSKGLEATGKAISKPVNIPKGVEIGYQLAKGGRTINLPMSEQTKQEGLMLPAKQKSNKQQTQSKQVQSYSDNTPEKYTGQIKYKSPKLKSNVFSGRKLTKSSAY